MDQKLWDFIGAPNCAKYSAASLLSAPRQFFEDVTLKTDLIEEAGLVNTSLPSDVYLLRDLVRDVITQSYKELPFLAFAHICGSLDNFVAITDGHPDYHKDGLFDDIKVISRTREKFKDEIKAYLKWRKMHPNL